MRFMGMTGDFRLECREACSVNHSPPGRRSWVLLHYY
jgi:hypothetical protein